MQATSVSLSLVTRVKAMRHSSLCMTTDRCRQAGLGEVLVLSSDVIYPTEDEGL
jgi:hypothetical protein